MTVIQPFTVIRIRTFNVRSTTAIICCSSPSPSSSSPPSSEIKTDQLRSQIDQLNAEALAARHQVNSTRLRLMRLSEAAERLKRQAAISVDSGKENDARELLFQKKKVIQAMDKTKARIEFLDQLSAKLVEAISVKESQLIGNIAVEHAIEKEDVPSPIRIISPKQGDLNRKDQFAGLGFDSLEPSNSQDVEFPADHGVSSTINKELLSAGIDIDDEDSIITSLKSMSSFEDFFIHLDLQLNRMEVELVTILNVSSLVLNGNERPENSKVQQITEILESILAIRHRIADILQKKG